MKGKIVPRINSEGDMIMNVKVLYAQRRGVGVMQMSLKEWARMSAKLDNYIGQACRRWLTNKNVNTKVPPKGIGRTNKGRKGTGGKSNQQPSASGSKKKR